LLYKWPVEKEYQNNGVGLICNKMNPISFKLIIVILLLAGMGGCRFPWLDQSVEVASQPSPEIRAEYDKALESYQNGDYSAAAKQFEALRERSSGGSLARIALYAQACAQLMAAETPQGYQVALTLWRTWLSSAPTSMVHESPVLMAPLVEEKMLFSNLRPSEDDAATLKQEHEMTQWVLIKTRQEMDHLKKQLAVSEKNVKQRDLKLKKLEKQIAKLKEQMRALESIDQKIQKKKSSIPSAD
jgi:hypothetical protein